MERKLNALSLDAFQNRFLGDFFQRSVFCGITKEAGEFELASLSGYYLTRQVYAAIRGCSLAVIA